MTKIKDGEQEFGRAGASEEVEKEKGKGSTKKLGIALVIALARDLYALL